MIFLLLLFFTSAWIAVFRFKRRRMYKLADQIPGPKDEHPMFGIAPRLMGNTEDIMTALKDYSYESIEYNGVLRCWLGHILYFVMTDPQDLEVVLKTCLEKDDLHRFIKDLNGYGSIFAPVAIWKKRRKILTPAFKMKIIEKFVEVFTEQSDILAKRLEKAANGKINRTWPYLGSYMLDSVCETSLGVKIGAQNNPDTPFLTSVNRLLNMVCERIFHLWLQPEWLFRLLPRYAEYQRCLNYIHTFTDEVIINKRKEIQLGKDQNIETDSHCEFGIDKRKNFLDLLISLSGGDSGYTNKELREELLMITIAGTDTSAITLGYLLILLAKYPEVQQKVYEELYEIYGDSDRPLMKEDLVQLKYTERVIKETMRLFPPAPFVARKILKEIALPSGKVLPAGSGVVASIWGVHRDPRYWGPNAEHFDPDRFLPDRLKLPHSCCYMPFSSGPRNCIGYQYAMMSVKTAISTVVRRFRVFGEPEAGPVPQVRVKLDILMKAVDECQVALERRRPNITV